MSLQCPFCASEQVQPHAVVHAHGTQTINMQHSAVHNGQLLQARSTGIGQSSLAQHCQPPAPPSPMPFVIAYGIGTLVTYLAFQFCQPFTNKCSFSLQHAEWIEALIGLAIVGVGFLLMKSWYGDAQAYHAAKKQWQQTWFCHTCGQSHVRD